MTAERPTPALRRVLPIGLCGVVLLACFSPPALGQRRSEPILEQGANFYSEQGVRYAQQGDYERAVREFRQANEIEPNQPLLKTNLHLALKNLSIQLAEKGEAGEAIRACSEAHSLYPQDITVASNLVTFFINRAVELLNQLKLRDTSEATRFNDQNDAALREAMGVIETAQDVVNEFQFPQLRTRVREIHAHAKLLEGRFHFLNGNPNKALEFYEECLSLNPQEIYAYVDRSRIYRERSYFNEALADLYEALDLMGGAHPKLEQQIQVLKLTAEGVGYKLAGTREFFAVRMIDGNLNHQRTIRNLLKDIRKDVSGALRVSQEGTIEVTVNGSPPFLSVDALLENPPEPVSGSEFTMGANGIRDFKDPEFVQALRFRYVQALLANTSGEGLPYWFVSGLAQALADDQGGALENKDVIALLGADENNRLLGATNLTRAKVEGLAEPELVRLANLESKAIVSYVIDTAHMSGIGQVLEFVRGGMAFDQALVNAARIRPEELDREWKVANGIRRH